VRWMPVATTELSASERAAVSAAMPDRVRKAVEREGKQPKARWRIEGIASTEHEDQQGDTILQDGVDWTGLIKRGFINDDHGEGVDAILGYPVAVKPTTVKDGNKTVKATHVVGYLFDLPKAAERVRLAEAMQGTDRQMGFSVEGPKPERDPRNPKIIRKAQVHHLALTPWPVNPHAAVQGVSLAKANRLLKSFTEGERLRARIRAAAERAGLRKAMTTGAGIATPGAAVPGSAAPLVPEALEGAFSLDSLGLSLPQGGDRAAKRARLRKIVNDIARRMGVDHQTAARLLATAVLKGAPA